ncbi:hypothetical protein J2T03_003272 [Chryseobacterium lathyri]|nr:hypothetical protein [Chryseobacterium lathyri]
MIELIRMTEVPTFSLTMTIVQEQAHKPEWKALKWRPRNLFVRRIQEFLKKLLDSSGKNFLRYPKRFFYVNDAVLSLQE